MCKPPRANRLQLFVTVAVAAFVLGQLAHDVVGQSITIPNTFVNGTTADATQVNANFNALASNALNRNAGTMLGLLTTQDLVADGSGTRDIGSNATKYRDLFLSRNATVGGTLGVTGATTLTGATTITSTSLSIGGAAYTYPASVGAAGATLRATNGTGTLAWSTAGWTVVTTTSTGTQNNFDPGIAGNTVIRANNASVLTITGFPAGVDGQQILVLSINAEVDCSHASGSSSVGNRLTNTVTSAVTPSVGGFFLYVYDATTAVWRLTAHEQAGWIAYTPTWGNTGTANTLGNAVITGSYLVRGRTVFYKVSFTFGSSSTAGSSAYTFTLPLTAANTLANGGAAYITDSGTGNYGGVVQLFSTTTIVVYNTNGVTNGITGTVPMAWTTNDNVNISGFYEIG